jgi:hypothetical protein
MLPGGIRTHNPESDRPQIHALDRAATLIGVQMFSYVLYTNVGAGPHNTTIWAQFIHP